MSDLYSPPSMPFYGRDFYMDEAVLSLSFAHHGLYLRLLWFQWQEGSIPADTGRLANISGHPAAFRKLWPDLEAFFPRTTEEGRRANPTLETHREAFRELSEKRASAGRKGMKTRWQTDNNGHNKRDNNGDNKTGNKTNNKPLTTALPSSSVSDSDSKKNKKKKTSTTRARGDADERRWNKYLYDCDRISKWLQTVRGRLAPGDEDFDAEFEAEFQFTWAQWEARKEAMEQHSRKTA